MMKELSFEQVNCVAGGAADISDIAYNAGVIAVGAFAGACMGQILVGSNPGSFDVNNAVILVALAAFGIASGRKVEDFINPIKPIHLPVVNL